MTYKADLEQRIYESYKLIREYEEILRLSSDPKERARAQRTIEEQWQFIKEYLDEYIPLCQRINVEISTDVLEIAVRFPEYEAFFQQGKKANISRSSLRRSDPDGEVNIGSSIAHQSVEIRIAKTAEPHRYSVELNHPGVRDFPTQKMILNSADLLIHNVNARDYGLLLGQALFADTALGDDFRESLAVLQREGKNLRLRLRLDDLDLHNIRWERLHYPMGDQWNPMAITASTPFSRYILAEDWGQPQPISQRPLRILVIIATPEDLNQYGLSTISPAERQAVHAIFDGLPDVAPTYLETGTSTPPTLENIRRELASEYHMVHFVCHGTVRQPGTILYLEKETGGVELVSAEKLIGGFRAAGRPPHFCFLAACESAAHSRFDAFMPLGPRLVAEGGLTAVVAMSDKVSLTTANKFTGQLYTRLLSHGYIDLAVNEARALVRDNWDWSVPVLFSRLLDNQLLAVSEIAHLEDTPSEKLKRQSTQQMSLSAIRRQLKQKFDDLELDGFCLDYFPQVYDKFSQGMRKDAKINLLLDQCRRRPDDYQRLLIQLEKQGK